MRTKSKAIRRNNGDQPLQDYWSVSADGVVGSPSVGVDFRGYPTRHRLVGVSIDADASLDSNTGHGVSAMDMFGSGIMDIDASFDYTNVLRQGSITIPNVVGVSTRLSNGITINEPHPVPVTSGSCRERLPVFTDATGKGKRKIDDIPPFTTNGTFSYNCLIFSVPVPVLF